MTHNKFSKELSRFTLAEKILFFFDIGLAILIIFFSQKLIQSQFGKASLTFGIVMLGLITVLKVLKIWGPKS